MREHKLSLILRALRRIKRYYRFSRQRIPLRGALLCSARKQARLLRSALSCALNIRNVARNTDMFNYKCEIHCSRVRAGVPAVPSPTHALERLPTNEMLSSVGCTGELLRAATIPKSRRSHEKSPSEKNVEKKVTAKEQRGHRHVDENRREIERKDKEGSSNF